MLFELYLELMARTEVLVYKLNNNEQNQEIPIDFMRLKSDRHSYYVTINMDHNNMASDFSITF